MDALLADSRAISASMAALKSAWVEGESLSTDIPWQMECSRGTAERVLTGCSLQIDSDMLTAKKAWILISPERKASR